MILALCIRRKKKRRLKNLCCRVFLNSDSAQIGSGCLERFHGVAAFYEHNLLWEAMRSLLRHTDDCYLRLYLGDLG